MCRTSSHLYGLVPVSFFCYHLCRYFFLGKKGFLVEKEKCACSREQAHFEIVASPSDFSESTEFSPGRSDASNYDGRKRNLHGASDFLIQLLLCFGIFGWSTHQRFFAKKDQNHPILLEGAPGARAVKTNLET